MLPPYVTGKSGEWYSGTANAIYQNIQFIEQFNTDYVLILSGDHIYKMDYNKMLQFHIQNNADCTIAVREVPWEEASRFGIMNTNEDNSISEFEEKPAHPKSNKASMGVYIFTWEKLRQYLVEDAEDPNSANDFGKNIIPKMLGDEQRMFAYDFKGYWKDVGTIESLWEANMDLLTLPMPIDLYDTKWRIYGRNPGLAPHFIAEGASVRNSLITEGCEVFGNVDHSVIFSGVTIRELEGDHEIVSVTGTVSHERLHMHVSLSREDLSVIGGHLAEGCIIKTTAEIVLLEMEDVAFGKVFDPATGYHELDIRRA